MSTPQRSHLAAVLFLTRMAAVEAATRRAFH